MRMATVRKWSRWIRSTIIVLLLGAALPLSGQAQSLASTESGEEAVKLLQVDERVFLGVIRRDVSLADALSDFDVVVDLRFPYEGVYDEAGALKGQGVLHVNIPTSSHGPDPGDVDVLDAMFARYPDARVLIHDSNGRRSAMIWAAHLLRSGSDLEQALGVVGPFYEPERLRPVLERGEQRLTSEGVD
jgi:rhodanese-related sulfurtransferase